MAGVPHIPGDGANSLIDYKKGQLDPNDPTSPVGSRSASGANVTYNYNMGENYTYQVWETSEGYTHFATGRLKLSEGQHLLRLLLALGRKDYFI